jgi:hypothetical protein
MATSSEQCPCEGPASRQRWWQRLSPSFANIGFFSTVRSTLALLYGDSTATHDSAPGVGSPSAAASATVAAAAGASQGAPATPCDAGAKGDAEDRVFDDDDMNDGGRPRSWLGVPSCGLRASRKRSLARDDRADAASELEAAASLAVDADDGQRTPAARGKRRRGLYE